MTAESETYRHVRLAMKFLPRGFFSGRARVDSRSAMLSAIHFSDPSADMQKLGGESDAYLAGYLERLIGKASGSPDGSAAAGGADLVEDSRTARRKMLEHNRAVSEGRAPVASTPQSAPMDSEVGVIRRDAPAPGDPKPMSRSQIARQRMLEANRKLSGGDR
ncbi:MAG: hypothetical protein ACOCXM_03250 [Myxococcota bacterium]